MDYLRQYEEIHENYHPGIIEKEVSKSEIHKQANIYNNTNFTEFNIEGGEFFSKLLRVHDLAHIVGSPDQKQELHIEDHKQNNVGNGW